MYNTHREVDEAKNKLTYYLSMCCLIIPRIKVLKNSKHKYRKEDEMFSVASVRSLITFHRESLNQDFPDLNEWQPVKSGQVHGHLRCHCH